MSERVMVNLCLYACVFVWVLPCVLVFDSVCFSVCLFFVCV